MHSQIVRPYRCGDGAARRRAVRALEGRAGAAEREINLGAAAWLRSGAERDRLFAVLVTSTVFTLLALPTFYQLTHNLGLRLARRQ